MNVWLWSGALMTIKSLCRFRAKTKLASSVRRDLPHLFIFTFRAFVQQQLRKKHIEHFFILNLCHPVWLSGHQFSSSYLPGILSPLVHICHDVFPFWHSSDVRWGTKSTVLFQSKNTVFIILFSYMFMFALPKHCSWNCMQVHKERLEPRVKFLCMHKHTHSRYLLLIPYINPSWA